MSDGVQVSAIITAFNVEKYLGHALTSVLEQTFTPAEILIVDDGSQDATRTLAESFQGATYFYQPNQGISAARNAGILRTERPYLAFLDGDDVWHREKLERQIGLFQQDPSLDCVFGMVQNFYSPELTLSERRRLSAQLAPHAGYVAGTMLVRRESLKRVGLFSSDYRIGEFIDWFARAKESGLKMGMTPATVLMRRIHTTNSSILERDSRIDFARLLHQKIKRARERD